MPLVEKTLEIQLLEFFKNNNKTPEKAAKELASIITNYIKTATVTVNGTGAGANAGGPIATIVTGTGLIS
jgi:hypothetical protein